jgi:hypothetical protein
VNQFDEESNEAHDCEAEALMFKPEAMSEDLDER